MKALPIGIENFKTMIDKNVYYVDKTDLISETMNKQLALYTRPRRFGKTLNMSMLYYFFSNKEKENAYLFDGLNISKNLEVMKHQNQYPVIFMTLKDMKNISFRAQKEKFSILIFQLMENYQELLTSDNISDAKKTILNNLHYQNASEEQLKNSLQLISQALYEHYHQKVIILIDEYDVPLQSAYANGYYDEMVDFLRSVFSSSLKTNDAIEKAIFTGCLRISKESIFTGLNNFNVYSLLDEYTSTRFGFTEEEVKQMLSDYDMSDQFDKVKEWYDGYLFGKNEIYNPWSVLKYVLKYIHEKARPESYWANTSGNDIVYDYIQNANQSLYDEFEMLMQGKTIEKTINLELTYGDMDDIDNIYSFLLLTGYLKVKAVHIRNRNGYEETSYELVIPNREVYEIYHQSFMKYFRIYTRDRKANLYQALMNGDTYQANTLLNEILSRSISYYNNQENFYHGFLVGLFSDEVVESNRKSGNGRFDICILPRRIIETAIVIECKHSLSEDDLFEDSEKGAEQIIEKRYLENQRLKRFRNRVGYGISFYKKQCYITKAQL